MTKNTLKSLWLTVALTFPGCTQFATDSLSTSGSADRSREERPTVSCGSLAPGQALSQTERLTSCNGQFQLSLQTDGNLVLATTRGGENSVLWSSLNGRQPGNLGKPDERGGNGKTLVMQTDGNLVMYNADQAATWHTRTVGCPGASLKLTDDGSLVISHREESKWSSKEDHLNRTCRPSFSPDFGESRDAVFVRNAFQKIIGTEMPASEVTRHVDALRQGLLSPTQYLINLFASPEFTIRHATDLVRPEGMAWLMYRKLLNRQSAVNPCIPGAPLSQVSCNEVFEWAGRQLPTHVLTQRFLAGDEFRTKQRASPPDQSLLVMRAYCAVEQRNFPESYDSSLAINSCLNLVAPGGLVLFNPGIYYVQNSIMIPPGSHGVTLATSGYQNSTTDPCAIDESPQARNRCAIFAAATNMERGVIMSSVASANLTFAYVGLHGQIHNRRAHHHQSYAGAGEWVNARIQNCHNCGFYGFASMYSVGQSALIFNGHDAVFRKTVFRDNGYGINRRGSPGGLAAHSDGLSVQFSDRIVVQDSLFQNNSDAHLVIFRAIGGDVSHNYFQSVNLGGGQQQNFAYTAIDLEHGFNSDNNTQLPGYSSVSDYGSVTSEKNYLDIHDNRIDGGQNRGIGVAVNIGTFLWYRGPHVRGGAIRANTIENSRFGILVSKATGTLIEGNLILNSGGQEWGVCRTAPITIVDSPNITYSPNSEFYIPPAPGTDWEFPHCGVGNLFPEASL